MAHTKRIVAMRPSPLLKRSKSVGGVKFSSMPSSPFFDRHVVAIMSHMPSPDRANHDALLPLLDQGAISASRAFVDGHSTLYQQTLELGEELSQECLMVEALEQKLQGLRLQATEASHHPWELKRAQE
ncbi:hypothetical protein LIER_14092 [Lithospermum erythrorhizon]|uniref:Uncharacterized protein n=1 Tax=Lithospermum erythrorhizon TaxID=34254 RepID=A0AAV3Q0B8_LITER